jgi:hypothetical protein
VPRFSCTNWKEHQGVQALSITIHPVNAENSAATTICAAAGAERAGCGRGWHRAGRPAGQCVSAPEATTAGLVS